MTPFFENLLSKNVVSHDSNSITLPLSYSTINTYLLEFVEKPIKMLFFTLVSIFQNSFEESRM